MLKTAGLSLDQAPSLHVPFALFLAAPLFVMVAGALLLWQAEFALASRWSAPALAATHLIALGFVTQVMCGALFQMLPVLAGAPVPRVVLVGRLTQGFLIAGTLALAFGLLRGNTIGLTAGGALLASGLIVFAMAVGGALARARGVRHTVVAMRLALVALLVTLLLGLLLVAIRPGWLPLPGLADWVDLHLAWGFWGWIGLLIMGAGYQVVPMFHVTPAYPPWLTRLSAPLTLTGLLLASALTALGQAPAAAWSLGLAALGGALFALVTLDRQRRRERPSRDATLLHWWLAMGAALLATLVWLTGGSPELIGILVLLGVGVGLPSGMLCKIVPFLSWFHLQHRQVAARRFEVRIPHMHVFLPESPARLQFGLHLLALLTLAAAAALPAAGAWMEARADLTRLGGCALILAAGLLEWLLLGSVWRYRACRRRLEAPAP